MTQKARYFKEFKKHKYWKYQFIDEGSPSNEVQIVLFKLYGNWKAKDAGVRDTMTVIPVMQCLELTDEHIFVYNDPYDPIYIKFPLDEGDSLTQVSKEYYKLFLNLGGRVGD